MAWSQVGNLTGPQGPAGAAVPVPVSIANGGTGATTAAAALQSLGAAPIAGPAFSGGASFAATVQFNAGGNAAQFASRPSIQWLGGGGTVVIPRIFVQSGNPGSAAYDGDLWIY